MATLAVVTWIGNAAAVQSGPWGAVTQHTQQVGCSRPTASDHADRVQQAVAHAQAGGPSRPQLHADCQRLQQENQQLWHALEDTVTFGPLQQRRFAATAAALGLSLNQTRVLLARVVPEADCPHRSTLDRWVDDAARRAGQVLQVLDSACPPLVQTLCLDEIFCHRVPVLMAVEPHSLTWVIGQRGPDRSGATWHQVLQPWTHLAWVTCDDGTGLQRGLEAIRADRRQTREERPLEDSLDVFHTRRAGDKAQRRDWSEAEQVWQHLDKAERALAQTKRRGQDQRGNTQRLGLAWRRAQEAFQRAERRETAWRRAARALDLFRPDGRLNDRTWAEAEVRAALPDLDGPRWAKTCRMLADPRSLNFLDRLHRDLAAAEPRAELRQALVALGRQRQATRPGCGPRPSGSVAVVTPLVWALVCARREPDWHGAYRRVARVLNGVVRASSVVECLKSVVRRHQARHRTLRQPLLDLKRRYWNCRELAEGKRAEHCPDEHLGLRLPTCDWWALLNMDPQELKEKVSTPQMAK